MTLPQPTDAFAWVQATGGPALVCAALAPYADHLFTTRGWRLGSAAQPSEADWVPVAAALGVDASRLIRVRQIHGANVVVHRAGDVTPLATPLAEADIIVSSDPGVALAVQSADCVPLLVVDRRTRAVAAAHAGWRGLAARVPSVTVAAMTREFGSRPDDLIVAVGPSVSADRYEVGADVRDRFEAAGFSRVDLERWFRTGTRPGHWQFDGWQSARDQLEAAGVTPASIHVAALCTATHADLLCSYRRDGKGAGRVAGAIRKVKS